MAHYQHNHFRQHHHHQQHHLQQQQQHARRCCARKPEEHERGADGRCIGRGSKCDFFVCDCPEIEQAEGFTLPTSSQCVNMRRKHAYLQLNVTILQPATFSPRNTIHTKYTTHAQHAVQAGVRVHVHAGNARGREEAVGCIEHVKVVRGLSCDV